MSSRAASTAILISTVVAAAMLLAGCTSGGTPVATPPAVAGPPTSPTSTTPGGNPSAYSTVAPPALTAGCKATHAHTPPGAKTRVVGDLDGDGRPDTEWISDTPTLRFGVTTASGATFSYPLSTASPAPREGFAVRLNDHRVFSLVDDNRSAYVHFIVKCAWVMPKDSHGVQYTYDMHNFHGHGTGVGCSFGYVVGYQTKDTSKGWTLKQTQLYLSTTGDTAVNGPTSTVAAHLSSRDPRLTKASTISCGSVTVKNEGVTLG
jgi:hypothetical protein